MPASVAAGKRPSLVARLAGCWYTRTDELLPHELTVDDIQPEVMPHAGAHAGRSADSGLPAGALKFAMAAKQTYPSSTSTEKGHRRIISADSVMDPFAGEWAAYEAEEKEVKEWKEVKELLDLPDEVLRSLAGDATHLAEVEALALTCRRTSSVLFPEAKRCQLLRKVACPSVVSLRDASVLFWQASEVTDDDLVLFTAWLDRLGEPLSHLHTLYLNGNLISDRGLAALLGCSALKRLHHLSLADNMLTDGGGGRLAASLAPGGALPGLHELNVRGNPLTEGARSRLRGFHHQNRMYVAL